jgi:hypothetical protein
MQLPCGNGGNPLGEDVIKNMTLAYTPQGLMLWITNFYVPNLTLTLRKTISALLATLNHRSFDIAKSLFIE